MDKYKERQLELLQRIFDTWLPPTPALRTDHDTVPEGMIPYISTSDVHDYIYNIRVISSDIFFSDEGDRYENTEKGQVIAHYDSLEELVEDGWVLD